MNQKLLNLIDDFLSQKRKSEGGYAQITLKDMEQLRSIINKLIEAKCGPDPDGDYPIEFELCNRRIEYRPHFMNMPYTHATCEEKEKGITPTEIRKKENDAFEMAKFNLEVAMSEFKTAMRLQDSSKREYNRPELREKRIKMVANELAEVYGETLREGGTHLKLAVRAIEVIEES